MSRETDLAWCAGFFDGEGHVSYHRGYPNPKTGSVSAQMYANVTQVAENVEVLERFHKTVELGTLQNKTYKTAKKPKRVLTFGVREVEPLFILLRPYLGTEKTEDFQRALRQYMTHSNYATPEDMTRALLRDAKKMKISR